MKKLFVSLMAAAALFSACTSKSLNDKFNPQSYKEDIAKFIENKLLSESDKALMLSYFEIKKIENISPTVSYSDILIDAKHIAELQKMMKDKFNEGEQIAKKAIDELYNKPIAERESEIKEFAKTYGVDLKDEKIDIYNQVWIQQLINGRILDNVSKEIEKSEQDRLLKERDKLLKETTK